MEFNYNLNVILSLGIILVWPVIPLFWIPVHLFHCSGKRHAGIGAYIFTALMWIPWLFIVIKFRCFILQFQIDFPLPVAMSGMILFIAGLILQAWTAKVMGHIIIGVPEVTDSVKSTHVTAPPFNCCRHPTYFSHALMFFGVAILTGYIALFLVAVLDFILTYFIIIPLEEKELVQRLGEKYKAYMRKTPKFFCVRLNRKQ